MQHDDRLREEAVAWAARTGDPDFAEWDAFTQWLERSPEHARAYDRTVAAVSEAAEVLSAGPAAANDDGPAIRGYSRGWFGGAIAASAAVVMAIALWPTDTTYFQQTAPGEVRVISLGDGSRIDLAGGSRIEFDRDDLRFARLEHGRALFTIRHDEAAPFRVQAGDDTLLDVGTVFDVRLDDVSLSVAVGEGAVMFNPTTQAVRLNPGQALRSRRGAEVYQEFTISPAQVGEWREGRLTFRNASLAEVAEDLGSATGLSFRAASGGGGRSTLSGSILVAPLRDDPRTLDRLLNVTVTRQGDTWLIAPR